MATETLNPNAVGTTNEFSLSAGSGDTAKVALVNDGDDATYVESTAGPTLAQYWAIRINGTTIYDADVEPGENNSSTSLVNLTRVINHTTFSGCLPLTTALITSLEIGMKASSGGSVSYQLFNLDNPTFPDDATINSATIHARLSLVSNKTRIHEISLVVDWTEFIPTGLTINSGTVTLKGGNITIK